MPTIDLNCDLGESFGHWTLGDDEAMLDIVTSANIACGFHAGDPTVMRRTVAMAMAKGVAIGAHPGYADLRGFGRVAVSIPAYDLANDLLYQIGALAAMCRAEGADLRHVKAHGALYNTAAREPSVAETVAEAVAAFDPSLLVVAPAGSPAGSNVASIVENAGLRAVPEAFIDRAYHPDGTLAPREQPGSVIFDPEHAADRALELAAEGTVRAVDGTLLELHPRTLCVHGDSPNAAGIATRVREALEAAGIGVQAFA